jgi:hypothetical protein
LWELCPLFVCCSRPVPWKHRIAHHGRRKGERDFRYFPEYPSVRLLGIYQHTLHLQWPFIEEIVFRVLIETLDSAHL